MSSSNQPNTLEAFLSTNDFTEIARKAREEKAKQAEEARLAALQPKITEQEVQAAERKGFEQGVEQGKQEALALLKAEMEQNVGTMRAKFDGLESMKTEYSALIEGKMLELISHVLEKTVSAVSEKFPKELLQASLKTALLEVQDQIQLAIRVNAETKSYLNECAAEILAGWQVQWIEDESLSTGDCLLEWADGGIDLRNNKMLTEISSLIEGAASATGANEEKEEVVQTAPPQTADPVEDTIPETPENGSQAEELTPPESPPEETT